MSTTPFDLVSVNGELRIHDLEIGRRLGFDRPRDIRKLIERHIEKLNKINHCATVARRPDSGGREVTEYYLDRKQSIFICMKSETDKAFDVQADIVRVYDAYQNGTSRPSKRQSLKTMQPPSALPLMRGSGKKRSSGTTPCLTPSSTTSLGTLRSYGRHSTLESMKRPSSGRPSRRRP